MKIHFEERDTPPLVPYISTIMKQVISAGRRLYSPVVASSISISIVTAEEMAKINQQYRDTLGVTDVLSFPGNGQATLGDIIICLEVAESQAAEYGHSLERELAFLTAHGFLHLIGHDHQTPEDEHEMIEAQNKILERVGVPR